MKTITMDHDYAVRLNHRQSVQYRAGHTYERVPEFQANVIVASGAGRVLGAKPAPTGAEVLRQSGKGGDDERE